MDELTTLADTGLLPQARQLASPHCNARPAGVQPDLLVIHGISLPPGKFGGSWIEDLFMGRLDTSAHPYFAEIAGLEVSAHVLIRRDGQLLQFVPFTQRAWHAGRSCFAGRDACNDYSIGVELEGADEVAYETVQYEALVCVTRQLQQAWPAITPERIVGHSDIAPGRKTDPGPAFDWARYRHLLEQQA